MMEFYKNDLTQKNAKKQKAWNNLSKGVMSNNKEKYKKQLSDREISLIEKICYYEMKYLSYEPQHSLATLNAISSEDVNKFADEESKRIEYNRTEGEEKIWKQRRPSIKNCFKTIFKVL